MTYKKLFLCIAAADDTHHCLLAITDIVEYGTMRWTCELARTAFYARDNIL